MNQYLVPLNLCFEVIRVMVKISTCFFICYHDALPLFVVTWVQWSMICIGLCLAVVLHLNQPNNLLEFYVIAHCFIFCFNYKTNHQHYQIFSLSYSTVLSFQLLRVSEAYPFAFSFLGSSPVRVDDLCFYKGEFPPSPSSSPPPFLYPPPPPSPYLSLEAHIPAWRPKSQS